MTLEGAMLVLMLGLVGQPAGPGASAPAAGPGEEAKAATADAASAKFAARLAAVDAGMAKVTDLRADFEQRRRTPLLKRPLVSKGTVLTKGDLVRWDTASPRESVLVIGHGSIRMYYPADKLVEVYPVGEGFKDLAGAPLPRLSVLRERFELSPLAASDPVMRDEDEHSLAVLLTPKSEELRKHVTSVKVVIDEAGPVAKKVVITDPEGEETEIVFTHTRLNGGVRDDEIELRLPEGVRVSKPLGEERKPAADAGPGGKTPGSPAQEGAH
ncbi:MAG: outer membrane lipoprotein carrier protein LolA [Phycisphaerales bacterium]